VHVALATPYADVRAADLVHALDGPEVPGLGVLRAEVGGFAVELRLLGHSHQVAVTPPLGAVLLETVACRPGVPGDLPARRDEQRGTLRYAFTASVVALDAASRGVADRVAADPLGLVGVFPGDPGAFTALRAAPSTAGAGVRWETWHAYPQSNELVCTTGTLVAS
jgi:hypothetical protein